MQPESDRVRRARESDQPENFLVRMLSDNWSRGYKILSRLSTMKRQSRLLFFGTDWCHMKGKSLLSESFSFNSIAGPCSGEDVGTGFQAGLVEKRPRNTRNRKSKNGTHEQKLGLGRGRWILNVAAQCTIRYLAVRARATAGSVRKLVDRGAVQIPPQLREIYTTKRKRLSNARTAAGRFLLEVSKSQGNKETKKKFSNGNDRDSHPA
jgi:hypothetical protein